ncbi:MAG: hypothetical protein EPO26_11615 [Chloroflexota bacterium]|nr:MAG: hypothetical protein EPO26_11615 [Chloroflexota bacterium]
MLSISALIGAVGAFLLPIAADLSPSVALVPTTNVIGRTLWVSFATLFVPSLGLGAVVPAAVRGAVLDRRTSGRTVGAVYAAGTAGSILGVFVTGFLLIDLVGSRAAILVAGAAMLAVAVVALPARRTPVAAVSLALAVAVGATPLAARFSGPCVWESAYFCIQLVEEQYVGQRTSRSLKLDRLVHGSIHVEDPTYLDPGYLRVMSDLSDALVDGRQRFATLQIGGGSYTLARYLERRFPAADVDVIEIDPKVTGFAAAYLGLRADTRIRTFNEDARQFFLDRRPRGRYAIIYGDAFNDLSIPHHLTTREFAGAVHDALTPDGVYMTNVVDLYFSGSFLRGFIATLRTQFAHVDLVMDRATWDFVQSMDPDADGSNDRRRTFIVVASDRPLDVARVNEVAGRSSVVIARQSLDAYLDDPRTAVLTDDWAPVDKLVSPIFLSRPF